MGGPPIDTLGHYRLLSEIGRGGMGRVYLAEDTRLGRQVALKVLDEDVVADPDRLRRFETEARAAAALNHPNIVTLHSVEESGGTRFITMEMVRGKPLARLIEPGGLPLPRLLDLGVQLAQAIAAAHAAGIAHRDLKPDNVMVLDSGALKVLDFGLAKLDAGPLRKSGPGTSRAPDPDGATRTELDETTAGTLLGTVAYMSPEQAQGYAVDLRSDLFSFGVLLFEMATGQRPFGGQGAIAVLSSIVKDTPPGLREIDPSLPEALDHLVGQCLAKDPAARPASAAEVAARLEKLRDRIHAGRSRSRGLQVAIWGGAVLIVAAIVALIALRRGEEPRWSDERSLARIEQLVDAGRPTQAFELARSAPHPDRVPQRLWDRISTTVTLRTDPPGATASMRGWDAAGDAWQVLGTTPLEQVRIASAVHLLRLEKAGLPPLELAYDGSPAELTLHLLPDDTMAHVPAGRANLKYIPGFVGTAPVDLGDFLVGREEVTNLEYLAFIEAGGYERSEYWSEPFVDQGRELSFEEAMRRFVDATGRPGPSTWRLGRYPAGRDDDPVAGLSWFEAVAYARFAGKQLPTIFHWIRAAGRDMAPALVPAGNYGGAGPRAVDASVRPGAYGLYDTAGNVREWCWNSSGDGRYILGGGWNDPSYMFLLLDHRSPFDRSPSNGLRCVDYAPRQGPSPQASAPVVRVVRDAAAAEPATDEEFARIVRSYDYAPVDLDATAEVVGESPAWRRERVEYSAGYEDERMFGWLFLPKSSRPPYQTLVLVPGASAFDVPSSAAVEDLVSWDAVDFVVEDGRAVLYPVYKHMYERRSAKNAMEFDTLERRDAFWRWGREMRQSVRYLESRGDIDADRLAFYGSSWGAAVGPIFLALEPRFRAAVFRNGGLWLGEGPAPEFDAVNFVPRVHVPVLMLNGRYDSIFPLETAQQVMFERLGSPAGAKRHVVFDVGHDYPPRNEMIRETLEWLDTHLGRVR